MKAGQVFYTKEASYDPSDVGVKISVKGFMIVLTLGYVLPGKEPPDKKTQLKLIGNAGLLTFDDLQEFVGKEMVDIVIKKWESKYT